MHPDKTLREIGEGIKKSALRTLSLTMYTFGTVQGSEVSKEWLQFVEVGGQELIQSLKDGHLRRLSLHVCCLSCVHSEHVCQALGEIATTVNLERKKAGLHNIDFTFTFYKQ